MKIGYVRVSTEDQSFNLQVDALKKYGCDKIFSDKISGTRIQRDGLTKAFDALRPGDTFVVWKMDRLGRTVRQLKDTIDSFSERKISFCSLTEMIDTSTPQGTLFFHMLAAFAEFERGVIAERTKAGMKSAKEKGVHIGRQPPSPEAITLAKQLRQQRLPYRKISSLLANEGYFVQMKSGCTGKPFDPSSVKYMVENY